MTLGVRELAACGGLSGGEGNYLPGAARLTPHEDRHR